MAKPDRGLIAVNSEECKGCGLCVAACPGKVLHLTERLNRYGYRPAEYAGAGCTGCGICFFVCPEPGGIRVSRLQVSHLQVSHLQVSRLPVGPLAAA